MSDTKKKEKLELRRIAESIFIAKMSNPIYGPSLRGKGYEFQAEQSFNEARAFLSAVKHEEYKND